MPVMIGLGAAGLATSIIGGLSSASASASNAEAQAMQAEINRKWNEFQTEYGIIQQRGQAGLAEMQRLLTNSQIEEESLRALFQNKSNVRAAEEFQTTQYMRQSRSLAAQQQSSLASRGMGRGGTADAIKRQQESDSLNDLLRISYNADAQMSLYENQRNQQLKSRNLNKAQMPGAYIPSTPIPMPDTSGMMTGALFSALGQGFGGAAGLMAGSQGGGSAPSGAGMSTQAMRPGAVSTQPMNGGAALGIGTGSGFMGLGFGGNI